MAHQQRCFSQGVLPSDFVQRAVAEPADSAAGSFAVGGLSVTALAARGCSEFSYGSRESAARNGGGSHTRGAARRRAFVTLALTGLSTACYSYVPARPEGLSVGTQTQIRLTLDGTRDLAGALGPEVRVVRGIVQRSSPDSVIVRVIELQQIDGETTSSTGTVIAIARQHVADLDRRIASPLKSAVAVALVVGAIVIVYTAARPKGGRGQIIPPDGGPPAALVPQ